MGNGLHVDPETMNLLGKNVTDDATALEAKINELKNNVDALREVWTGNASDTFKNAVDEQVINLNNFKNLLNELGTKITEGAKRFSDTEDANVEAASSLLG